MPCVSVVAQDQATQTARAEAKPERFWLAGRYDGNRVIVYFDAVKFKGTLSSNSHELAPPVASWFFDPVRVSESYAVRFQNGAGAEHFSLGDKYDLLLDRGTVATVTLTTIIGAETDEEIGNDSFIGALATLNKDDVPMMSNNYYVLRRHHEVQSSNGKIPTISETELAGLENGPVRFDIQTKIVDLLTQRMKTLAPEAERRAAECLSPIVEVQAFHIADGSLRYYASAQWNSGEGINDPTSYALAAWIAPQPTIHILSLETRTFGYSLDEPKLLNVVDLGGGRTGMIVAISTGENIETDLFEYHEGIDIRHMRLLQSMAAGE